MSEGSEGEVRIIVRSHVIVVVSTMNLIQLVLLTIAVTSAFAAERVRGLARYDEAEIASNGRTAGVKGVANASGRRRELKGGMSTSKGGSKGSGDCTTLSIWIRTGDVMDNAIDSDNGYATKLDVYEMGSRKVIASWYEEASYINEAGTDGIGTGLLLWTGGASSISFSGALRQRALPINGGTGLYSCASGYIEATKQVGTQTFLDVNYCLTC